MTLRLHADAVFLNAIAGVPKVSALIATIPLELRSRALVAAERSYLQSALELGYDQVDAQQWTAAVMLRLRMESGLAVETVA